MKKIISLSLLSLLVLFCITSCGSKEINMRLFVSKNTLIGWDDNYNTNENKSEYSIEKNKEYILKSYTSGDKEVVEFSFKITKINDNSIEFKTNTPMSDNENGIDINTKKTKFILNKGESIKLITPTMDAVDAYIFDLE